MTGFGKSVVTYNSSSITIEIRTLNSKQLDINLKLPSYLKEKEIEARKLIGIELGRGKIDISVTVDRNSAEDAPVIDSDLAKHYYDEITSLSNKLALEEHGNVMEMILRMPDIFVTKEKPADEEELDMFNTCFSNALNEVNISRVEEGADLEKDFRIRISNILEQLEKVDEFDDNRVVRIRERIHQNISKYLTEHDTDHNRLEQEIVYYIEKLDITEEKVRLANNCKYFLENLDNEQSSGKKLGFITQEIGREINTLGSKANDTDLQKLVVLMKDELEKIKEQLFNIL